MSLVENKQRRHSWKEEEDNLLLETVLAYKREGKSQLHAFEEVAGKLARTAGACGFRFNNALREKYKAQLSNETETTNTVKKQRQKRASSRKDQTVTVHVNNQDSSIAITWTEVRKFLEQQQDRIEFLEKQVQDLQNENEQLRNETYGEEYKRVIHLLHRAHEMGLTIMEKDGKITFQMDPASNLEQIV